MDHPKKCPSAASVGAKLPQENERYALLFPIGEGADGTVWVGEQIENGIAVALKFKHPRLDVDEEVSVWKYLIDMNAGHKQHRILPILDHFSIDGKQGLQTVIVTELVVPLRSITYQELNKRLVCRQLFQAAFYIHTHHAVHGDIHIGNLGLRLSSPVRASDLYRFQRAEHVDISLDESTTPLFAHLEKRVDKNRPSLIVYDFANAQTKETGHTVLGKRQPPHVVAPEVLLHKCDTNHASMLALQLAERWSLACTAFEILAEMAPFSGSGRNGEALLIRLAALLGSAAIPSEWQGSLDYEELKNPYYSGVSEELWGLLPDAETAGFLRRLLVVDPARRQTPAAVLRDPWLCQRNGEPKRACPSKKRRKS